MRDFVRVAVFMIFAASGLAWYTACADGARMSCGGSGREFLLAFLLIWAPPIVLVLDLLLAVHCRGLVRAGAVIAAVPMCAGWLISVLFLSGLVSFHI